MESQATTVTFTSESSNVLKRKLDLDSLLLREVHDVAQKVLQLSNLNEVTVGHVPEILQAYMLSFDESKRQNTRVKGTNFS